eukprot:TRINITY_DN1303_c0_g4_i1.p1 TRINITY_DN1303_c0_g4~~TRINITY_DN1303_c0_g4_i1.p1  ORF type:complete len:333 (+),score=92.85 TRINITY_DN1303_c0_g4_i1:20-1018(+)
MSSDEEVEYETIVMPSELDNKNEEALNELYDLYGDEVPDGKGKTRYQKIAHLIRFFPTSRINFEDLSKFRLVALKDIAEELGVEVLGDKKDIIPGIIKAIVGDEESVITETVRYETSSSDGVKKFSFSSEKTKTVKGEYSHTLPDTQDYTHTVSTPDDYKHVMPADAHTFTEMSHTDDYKHAIPEMSHTGDYKHTPDSKYSHTDSDYKHSTPQHHVGSSSDASPFGSSTNLADILKRVESNSQRSGKKRRRESADIPSETPTKKRKLMVTSEEFEKKAEPVEFFLEDALIEASPKIFDKSSGTFGWYASGQEEIILNGKPVKVQFNLNMTVY